MVMVTIIFITKVAGVREQGMELTQGTRGLKAGWAS